jgi:hypothetical protein
MLNLLYIYIDKIKSCYIFFIILIQQLKATQIVQLKLQMSGECMAFCNLDQGRIGHITRWEKSHGAPLVWGLLRQSGAPQYHALFLGSQLNLWKFSGNEFFFCFFFLVSIFILAAIFLLFFGGPLKKIPPKFGELIRP